MNRTLQTLAWLCLPGMSGLFLSHPAISAEPRNERLEKILADWQERQHWFQSIEYKVRGTHKVPKGAYNNLPAVISGSAPDHVSPPCDMEAPIGFTFLLDFASGRHRRDNLLVQGLDEKSGRFIPLRRKDMFNGSVMKCLTLKEENPDHKKGERQPEMSIISGNMKSGEFRIDYYPIFFAHGRIYTPMEPIIPGQVLNKPNLEYLYLHGTVVHENRPCLILRTQTLKRSSTSFEEYWVDTARESAIVRYVGYSGKAIFSEPRYEI